MTRVPVLLRGGDKFFAPPRLYILDQSSINSFSWPVVNESALMFSGRRPIIIQVLRSSSSRCFALPIGVGNAVAYWNKPEPGSRAAGLSIKRAIEKRKEPAWFTLLMPVAGSCSSVLVSGWRKRLVACVDVDFAKGCIPGPRFTPSSSASATGFSPSRQGCSAE